MILFKRKVKAPRLNYAAQRMNFYQNYFKNVATPSPYSISVIRLIYSQQLLFSRCLLYCDTSVLT